MYQMFYCISILNGLYWKSEYSQSIFILPFLEKYEYKTAVESSAGFTVKDQSQIPKVCFQIFLLNTCNLKLPQFCNSMEIKISVKCVI